MLAQCHLLLLARELVGGATEQVDHTAAQGRILGQDVRALDPLPPFPASIKVIITQFTFGADLNSII